MKISLPDFKKFKSGNTLAFGMDISDVAIKIVQLKPTRTHLESEVSMIQKLPAGAILNGEIKDVSAVTKTLHSIISNKRLHLKDSVVASLPEARTFMQTILVPRKNDFSLEDRLSEVLPEHLPFELDEVYFDSLLLSEDERSWNVLVGAAPKQSVDTLLQILDAVNLLPLTLDLELAAAANALIPINEEKPKSRAIIDLGATRASLLLHDYGAAQFTMEVDIAGNSVTKEISRQLELSPEEAEKAKRSCGLDPQKCEGVLRKILELQIIETTKQINAANEYYRTHFTYGRPIEEVILTGGGARLLELDSILNKVLHVPVTITDPWTNHGIKYKEPVTDSDLTVAIGLALRGLSY